MLDADRVWGRAPALLPTVLDIARRRTRAVLKRTLELRVLLLLWFLFEVLVFDMLLGM